MKLKLILLIMILICGRLMSQEKYENLRVVTWIEIIDQDYTILLEEGDITVLIINNETVVIETKS
ncbi:MAG: hypothetical protein WC155_07220 [Candidatus Cloacimonadales bacterium]